MLAVCTLYERCKRMSLSPCLGSLFRLCCCSPMTWESCSSMPQLSSSRAGGSSQGRCGSTVIGFIQASGRSTDRKVQVILSAHTCHGYLLLGSEEAPEEFATAPAILASASTSGVEETGPFGLHLPGWGVGASSFGRELPVAVSL